MGIECRLEGCSKPPRPRSSKMGGEPVYCSREHAALGMSWRTRSREKIEEVYGVKYDDMLASQGGVCAICKNKCSKNKRLSFDHCHASGKLRGLLCDRCSVGLGNFRDSISSLRQAIQYLEGT